MYTSNKENSWRKHQASYIQRKRKKALATILLKRFLPVLLACGLLIGSWHVLDMGRRIRNFDNLFSKPAEKPVKIPPPVKVSAPVPAQLSKPQLREIIRDITFLNADKTVFFVDTPEKSYRVASTLDPALMSYLQAVQEKSMGLTRGKPRQIAVVAMDANTGRLLAMAGYDLETPGSNPCTRADFPAASIFKIVTAAAAVDALGYTPHTPLYFNGNKYTLYKRQLKETRNRYTVKTSLAKAFAGSINPVFGKLGKTYLGREKLATYADNFGFNAKPASDLTFEPGRFIIKDNAFHLAELGSGFNHETQISPVFGAMLVTAVLNSGRSLVPAVVDRVFNGDGDLLYRHKPEIHRTAITPGSADTMIRIMGKTISAGTARKSFRGYARDSVLSTLILGGKTGSLFNRERTIKYDWFTGFAKEKKGGKTLAVSIVVGHGKYIGTRAATHARNIFKQYFKAKILPQSG